MTENLLNKKSKTILNIKIPFISDNLLESSVFLTALLVIAYISKSFAVFAVSLFFSFIIIKKVLEFAGLKDKSSSIAYLFSFLIGFTALLSSVFRVANLLILDYGSLRIVWVGALLLVFFDIFVFYRKHGNIFKSSNFWIQLIKSRFFVFSLILFGVLLQILELNSILDFVATLIFAGFGFYLVFPNVVIDSQIETVGDSEHQEEELDTGVKENDAIRRLGSLEHVVSVDHFETWFGEEYVVWGAVRLVVRDTISQENLYITKVKAKKMLKTLGCQQMVVEIMYKSEEVV